MKEPPIRDERIRDERIIEAIEACRPGRDDLNDPALAHLLAELAANPDLAEHYERLQQLDANLGSAFQNVPVPDGLDQRLLARLEQAQPKNVPSPGEQGDLLGADRATAVRPRRLSRRRLLAAGGGVAVAAILMIAATVYIYQPNPYTQVSVLEQSVAFFQVESPNPSELVDRSPPPEAYPFSRSVGRVREIRWRPIGKFLGCKGIAYDLPICDQATLYVVRRTVPGLAATPPLRPQKDTGGLSAATWQEGELLYVLVLHGNNSPAVYRDLVNLPHGPLI